jgi:hypothetical protein
LKGEKSRNVLERKLETAWDHGKTIQDQIVCIPSKSTP